MQNPQPIITQIKSQRNRLKLKGSRTLIECEAGFLPQRGYFRLTPLKIMGGWQNFWDIWELHKKELKREGLHVTKEKGEWRIHYQPPKWSDIELDESFIDRS